MLFWGVLVPGGGGGCREVGFLTFIGEPIYIGYIVQLTGNLRYPYPIRHEIDFLPQIDSYYSHVNVKAAFSILNYFKPWVEIRPKFEPSIKCVVIYFELTLKKLWKLFFKNQ